LQDINKLLAFLFVSLVIMVRKLLILLIYCIPFLGHAQNDVLILQRRGMHVKAFTVGDPFTFKTVYGQWFSGTIDDLHHDTIYINNLAFSYKEIAAIRKMKGGNSSTGPLLMIAGGGFAVISAVNGLLRQDPPKDWFTTTGYIIAGALLAGGFALSKLGSRDYNLGGRFKLEYLQISKDRR
jgi:hypothetical protein